MPAQDTTTKQSEQQADTSKQEWRCEHCKYFLTGYRWVSGIFILERDRCPNCKRPVKSVVVTK